MRCFLWSYELPGWQASECFVLVVVQVHLPLVELGQALELQQRSVVAVDHQLVVDHQLAQHHQSLLRR